MSQQNRYSDEELLEQIRTCYERYGKCPARLFNEDDDFSSASGIARRFGSWSEAKSQAGIDEDLSSDTGRSKQYTDEEILAQLRQLEYEYGKCTTQLLQQQDDLVSPSVVIDRFDSWSEAKQAAGLESLDERKNNAGKEQQFSDESLLAAMVLCKQKHGKCTQRVFDDDDELPSSGVVRKRFGSWSEAKDRAGLDYTQPGNRIYSGEELLQQLRDCQERHGKCTASLFASDDDFASPEAVQRRFGSWNSGKEEAGLQ
ncbi:homing endonuclease associated repeat-containing protein [Halosegnis longus]|uniref:homing endonuclease associated repeat-containing protein n=1 Tax=Halosegnis longus TaxID=2216012 RepID=UPI00129EAF95|nr:hypothetical protein [Halosegnis longus]